MRRLWIPQPSARWHDPPPHLQDPRAVLGDLDHGCHLGAVSSTSAPAANLRTFGASVRRTGMTLGRDADVLEAVRDGHLSVSDAMNTDD